MASATLVFCPLALSTSSQLHYLLSLDKCVGRGPSAFRGQNRLRRILATILCYIAVVIVCDGRGGKLQALQSQFLEIQQSLCIFATASSAAVLVMTISGTFCQQTGRGAPPNRVKMKSSSFGWGILARLLLCE